MGVYAVIQTGGKQYRVSPGDTLKVEKLAAEPGEVVSLQDIRMLVADGKISTERSVLDKAQVKAEVLGHARSDKVIVFKFKRRKHYRKKQGHRQGFTELRITEITIDANNYKAEPRPVHAATASPAPKEPEATTQTVAASTTNKSQPISRATTQPDPTAMGPEAPADDSAATIATATTSEPTPKTSISNNTDIAAKAIIADIEPNMTRKRVPPSTTSIAVNGATATAGQRNRRSKHGLIAAVLIVVLILLLLFFYGLFSRPTIDDDTLPAIINVETKKPTQETDIRQPAPIIAPSEPDQPPE